MPQGRPPGVTGLGPDEGWGELRPAAGPSVGRAAYSRPGAEGTSTLSQEQLELVLDLTQFSLDIAGFLDPTPVSDGTNVVISTARRDWLGAGLSGLGIIPYVGDLAKVGKLGRYAQTVEKVIREARRNARFAERVRPVLISLRNALAEIPSKLVPRSAQIHLNAMKSRLDDFLYMGRRRAGSELVERYLRLWEKHIDDLDFDAPAKDRGALWSKLSAKGESDPGFFRGGDDPSIEGYDLAARLARSEMLPKQTLEMVLEPSKLAEKFRMAEAQLAEKLGRKVEWSEFGAKIWERVSVKYVGKLQGKVTVFVDDEVLKQALRDGRLPILSKELQALIRRKNAGDGITGIVIKDIFDGPVFEL